MTVRLYSSKDASAPTLNESSGSLITLLDACLVNGYGAKTAAGWAKSYSNSTTGAAYRAPAGNRHYLMVDDSGGALSRARIIVNATAWNAGEVLSPNDTSSYATGGGWTAGGVYLMKHDGVTGNRPWYLICNDRMLYFWTQWSTDTTGAKGALFYFGDVVPARSTDSYATLIGGGNYAATSSNWGGTWNATSTTAFPCSLTAFSQMSNFSYLTSTGKYWARSYIGIGPAVMATTQHDFSRLPASFLGNAGLFSDTNGGSWSRYSVRWDGLPMGYPNLVDNGLYLSSITASEAQYYRGTLPGLWASMSTNDNASFHEFRMFGTGIYAGKEFLFLGTPWGQIAFEVSDTW